MRDVLRPTTALTFALAGLATAGWILWGLSPLLTAITATASDGQCFIGHLALAWRPPHPGEDALVETPVSLAVLAGGLAAAAAIGASVMARRSRLPPLLPWSLALTMTAGGLLPFVSCRWGTVAWSGLSGMLPFGLTAMVACSTVLLAEWLSKALGSVAVRNPGA